MARMPLTVLVTGELAGACPPGYCARNDIAIRPGTGRRVRQLRAGRLLPRRPGSDQGPTRPLRRGNGESSRFSQLLGPFLNGVVLERVSKIANAVFTQHGLVKDKALISPRLASTDFTLTLPARVMISHDTFCTWGRSSAGLERGQVFATFLDPFVPCRS